MREARAGYVLVTVLSVLAVLAGLVSALMLIARANVTTAAGAADRLTDRSLIEAAKASAAYQLFITRRPPSAVDGLVVKLDAGTVAVRVAVPSGRVDLNASDTALIANSFAAAGGRDMAPGAFASRVADWRDADSRMELRGAEAATYRNLRLGATPPNHDFLSVDELRRLAGMTDADFRRIAPVFTVDNPAGKVDVLVAPETVLAALPGLDTRAIRTILRLRVNPGDAAKRQIETLVQAAGTLATVGAEVVVAELALDIIRASGGRRTLAVTIAADPSGNRPYRTLGESDIP